MKPLQPSKAAPGGSVSQKKEAHPSELIQQPIIIVRKLSQNSFYPRF